MTEAEFNLKLDRFKSNSRSLQIFGILIVVINVLLTIYFSFFFAVHANRHQVLFVGLFLFLYYILTIGGFIIHVRRYVSQNAPKCPNCKKPLTMMQQPQVIQNRSCPFCRETILEKPNNKNAA